MKLNLVFAIALMLTGCGSLKPGSVAGAASVLGDDLAGAQGKTLADQDKIDTAAARACAGGLMTPEACRVHTERSAERRRQLPPFVEVGA